MRGFSEPSDGLEPSTPSLPCASEPLPCDARDVLSPQELQIAEMAAAGLSNREIGQKVFLSHRTVESHLYRI